MFTIVPEPKDLTKGITSVIHMTLHFKTHVEYGRRLYIKRAAVLRRSVDREFPRGRGPLRKTWWWWWWRTGRMHPAVRFWSNSCDTCRWCTLLDSPDGFIWNEKFGTSGMPRFCGVADGSTGKLSARVFHLLHYTDAAVIVTLGWPQRRVVPDTSFHG